MSSLPDRRRPRLAQPARNALSQAATAVASLTWHALHPSVRDRYLEASKPGALRRVYYATSDGWQAPVFALPVLPGAPGEAVLLAHGLGAAADAFRYGSGDTLASRLQREGFAVYLLTHRGDREAVAPEPAASSRAIFDEVVAFDLDAAARVVLADAGCPRLHLVGHGLGGQLALAWAARTDLTATVVTLGSPMRFERPVSHQRWAATALALLPPRWAVPARRLAQLGAALVDDPVAPWFSTAPPARVRGALSHATADLSVGMLEQVLEWLEAGSVVSRGGAFDYLESLIDAACPWLAVVGGADPLCTESQVRPAVDRWGGEAELLVLPGQAHYDLLVGGGEALAPATRWLEERRRLAWEVDGPVGAGRLDARVSRAG